MEQERTWMDCKYSDKDQCIHRNENLIRELIKDIGEAKVDFSHNLYDDTDPITSETISKMTEVNKQFCNSCEAFQAITPQSHLDCEYFSIRNLCPHRDNELMVQFLKDTNMMQGFTRTINSSKSEEIDINICTPCKSFKNKRIK